VRVEVRNHTDQVITVYYDPAISDDESPWSWATIAPSDVETLRSDSVLWDADILGVYCQYAHEYDVDPGILGWDEVDVYVGDFPPRFLG
jgi:hypothetical protein